MGRIELHTMVTPSHREMLERYFLPSVNLVREVETHVHEFAQDGNGNFGTEGFNRTCLLKLYILRDLALSDAEIIIYSDCDVVVLDRMSDDIRIRLTGMDAVFQQDIDQACTGFFAFKPCEAMYLFFDRSVADFPGTRNNDQVLMNRHLDMIRWSYLPRQYYNISMTTGRKLYNAGDPVEIPGGLRIFHANWTIGVHNKYELLTSALKIHGITD